MVLEQPNHRTFGAIPFLSVTSSAHGADLLPRNQATALRRRCRGVKSDSHGELLAGRTRKLPSHPAVSCVTQPLDRRWLICRSRLAQQIRDALAQELSDRPAIGLGDLFDARIERHVQSHTSRTNLRTLHGLASRCAKICCAASFYNAAVRSN